MEYMPMNRRSFMLLAAGGVLMTVFPGCAREVGISEREKQALMRVARLLYPHDALTDDVYKEVLGPLQERAVFDSNLAAALRSGLDALDQAAGRDWLTASKEAQIEALKRLENGTFFQTVQNDVRRTLYEHPEVWKLVGYEGSSVEFGGYINRGFNDIDWLPED
jgi:hypothetical protein